MDGSWSAPPKRRSLRVPIEIPVVIERGSVQISGRTVNMGFGGAFIEAAEKFAYAERVELWMPLLDAAMLCPVRSLVRWSSGSGFGVQFLEFGAREAYALSELMRTAVADDRPTLTNIEADLLLEVSPNLGL